MSGEALSTTRPPWRSWGVADGPEALLVHGAGAHAGWWAPSAPALRRAGFRRLVAVDLDGHGDAPRRPSYSLTAWAQSLQDRARAAAMPPRPVVIAHSLGGVVALLAAQTAPERWGGLIIVDSPIGRSFGGARPPRAPRLGRSREEAMSRFRLLPDQPPIDARLLADLAADSIRKTEAGWVWKFDPAVFARAEEARVVDWGDVVDRLDGRVAYIVGESSGVVGSRELSLGRSALGAQRVVVVPKAHHHLILDRPVELSRAVEAQMATWST